MKSNTLPMKREYSSHHPPQFFPIVEMQGYTLLVLDTY